MELSKTRRALLGAVAAATVLSGTAAAPALAETFPSRPITLVIPFPPGGATDTQFRALASAASKELGQPIVVSNRAGVGGTLGPVTMARTAAPDGYTVAVLPGTLYRLPHLLKSADWDPTRDFTYIVGLTAYSFAITVAADSPWKTVPDMLAAAKAKPDQYSYGTVGTGSTGHIASSRLLKAAGVKMNFVPFKGAAEQQLALIGGHIDMVGDAGWGVQAKAGKIRPLALMAEKRAKNWPDVPTLKELGYDIVALSTLGIGGPKGMDPAVVKVLHDAFRKASKDPAFLEILDMENQPELYMDSAAYARAAAEQFESDRRFVAELGLTRQ
ncbi:Bug family tripartite tricarboxylate transporter substrate binding protein [Quisquiliibacterium transsilvanicum]|uniref:Tripartite-type tricarboxylate transporter receptor subunit TctC n=1 Tax=Quisquiliibacterium transsilvanicum TaxID=1549638 RepID=A0A7W8HIM9_9BURK|nr:tripartite tricarboxylate transporter substrate binding protein [Quisquiliibacterium transsilvanicum]MBB5272076.1 tripartite-type tricarboxylate transporter receptor subunit TctC [Quisquiliibacterium transsilvanicum]